MFSALFGSGDRQVYKEFANGLIVLVSRDPVVLKIAAKHAGSTTAEHAVATLLVENDVNEYEALCQGLEIACERLCAVNAESGTRFSILREFEPQPLLVQFLTDAHPALFDHTESWLPQSLVDSELDEVSLCLDSSDFETVSYRFAESMLLEVRSKFPSSTLDGVDSGISNSQRLNCESLAGLADSSFGTSADPQQTLYNEVRKTLSPIIAVLRRGDVTQVSYRALHDCSGPPVSAAACALEVFQRELSDDSLCENWVSPTTRDLILLIRFLSNAADMVASFAVRLDSRVCRSGPAAHSDFESEAFVLLKKKNFKDGVFATFDAALASLRCDASALTRTARHLERAGALLSMHAVSLCKKHVSYKIPSSQQLLPNKHWAEFSAPVRVDIAGGWTDTPPLCFELDGCVVNVAVSLGEDVTPIGCRARRVPRYGGAAPKIKITQIDRHGDASNFTLEVLKDCMDYSINTAPAALIKAALVCLEVVDIELADDTPMGVFLKDGGDLEIQSWSRVYQGSGLGTSSVLAGCVLAAVARAVGREFSSADSLVHAVFYLEQLLSSGGGWQDQIGGLYPGGAKVSRASHSESPLRVVPSVIHEPQGFFENEFNPRLVLIFTGRARVAKNCLQDVTRRWLSRDAPAVGVELKNNAERAAEAFKKGDVVTIGDCMRCFHRQKIVVAGRGAEPKMVTRMFRLFQSAKLTYGECIGGAGGGGFCFVLTKAKNASAELRQCLMDDSDVFAKCEFFDSSVVTSGMVGTIVGGQ